MDLLRLDMTYEPYNTPDGTPNIDSSQALVFAFQTLVTIAHFSQYG